MTHLRFHQNTKLGVFGTGCRPERLKIAGTLIKLISPLFFRDEGQKKVPEIGFYMSPKAIKVDAYRAKYIALKEFFALHGLDIAQTPTSA
jgi:hypothetical protein